MAVFLGRGSGCAASMAFLDGLERFLGLITTAGGSGDMVSRGKNTATP